SSRFVQRVMLLEVGERLCPRTDRVEEERELAARCETERHRARQHPPRCLQHEELSGDPWIEGSPRHPNERIRADRLDGDDATTLAPPPRHRSAPEAK